jgi:penicillin amidase
VAGESAWLLIWVVIGIVVVAALAASVQLRRSVTTRKAFPLAEGRVAVPGIADPITIHRDVHGIPHIAATNAADAFFGLGFVHAQDRLAQMVWLARVAHGRSAEAVGAGGLEVDRLARTLDFAGIAEREFERLDAATRGHLEAYARGVNARIARIRAGRVKAPLEIPRASEGIADWRAVDSLAVFKLYSWGLAASLDATLVLSDFIEILGGFGAQRFFPEPPDGFAPDTGAAVTARRGAVPWSDPLRAAMGLRGHAVGSSAWVVTGGGSESRAPLLVADAHLETTVPSLYYLAHFRGGGFDVAGATVPGIPVVWSGRNANVVWAATNARAVVTDLYEEKLSESDPSRYYDGRDWSELERRVEVLRVRGGDEQTLVVESTRHGPLINGLLADDRDPLALAWSGARATGIPGVGSMLEVAQSGDTRGLRRALSRHEDPPLAIVYAGRDGAAGMQVAGWIPRRPLPSGLAPLPGRVRLYDWVGRVDFDALPRRRIRAGVDWAIAADEPHAARRRSQRVEWLWRSGARAERIESMLRAATREGPTTLRTLSRLQTDVALQRARELIGMALRIADLSTRAGPEGREIAGLLQSWDGRAGSASTGAAVYHVFLERLTRRLLEPVLGEPLLQRYLGLPLADPDQVVFEIVRDAAGDGDWSLPTVQEAIHESLRETWFTLSYELGANRNRWLWGRLHPLVFRSFYTRKELTVRGADLGPFPYGGSVASVNAAEWARNDPFTVRVASTFRMAVDVASLDHLLVSLAPGQSEHPEHPHFADTVTSWREGRPYLLATAPLAVEESSGAPLVLEPAP